jgi:DNA-binding CsgD family transcriptional regulator
MNTKIANPRSHYLLYIFSILIYLTIHLLYSWGSPRWFIRLPSASGFKMILALEFFFLSAALFFFVQLLLTLSKKKDFYWTVFFLSFLPVPVFSVLVISGVVLQTIHVFAATIDIAVWLFFTGLLVYFGKDFSSVRKYLRMARIWGVVAVLQACMGVLDFLSILHGSFTAAVRFVIAFFCLFLTLNALVSESDDSLKATARMYSFSRRETEVFGLLAEGKTNLEIADALFISLSTVKMHIARIFQKTGARNRLEAVRLIKK